MAPHLTLMRQDAPQRRHDLRECFNALRWIVRTGAPWRMLPTNFPPWEAVDQQTHRWITVGVFEAMVHDLPVVLRWLQDQADTPTAMILDSRTLRSTPERGHRAGYDGHERTKGSKIYAAVDTLGHLLTLTVTSADAQDRAQVADLTAAVQALTGETVEVAVVDEGYPGDTPAAQGIALEVVMLPEAKRGFVLLPRRWVVERSFAWASRFRRLVRDDERLPETVTGLYFLAFACLMLDRMLTLAAQSPYHPLVAVAGVSEAGLFAPVLVLARVASTSGGGALPVIPVSFAIPSGVSASV